jgi:integrase
VPSRKTSPPKFPLWVHKHSQQWVKKLGGQFYYFGAVADDPTGERALKLWLSQADNLKNGRKPRAKKQADEIYSVAACCNDFLNMQLAKLKAKTKEISPRTFADNRRTCDLIIEHFGAKRSVASLEPEDFAELRVKLAERRKLVALGNEIVRVRQVFNRSHVNRRLGHAIDFGEGFGLPKRDALDRERAEKGPRLFAPDQIKKLIEVADVHFRAMILLGINGGLGNNDLAQLELRHLDLESGWLNYPRPKNGKMRRAKLWGETVEAIKASLAARREPRSEADANKVFLTRHGNSWAKPGRYDGTKLADVEDARGSNGNHGLAARFQTLCKRAGAEGRTFYDLRRSFRTVADGVIDDAACDQVMGHVRRDMGSRYRQGLIPDPRLEAVATLVHDWLYPPPAETERPVSKKSGPRAKKSEKSSRPKLRLISA